MSEIDSIKEEINFFRTIIQIVLTALFAVSGWFMLYDGSDEKSGMALASMILLIGVWLVVQSMMFKLIRKLKEL